jgi:putative acetyltransferase
MVSSSSPRLSIRRACEQDAEELTRIHTQKSSYYWTLQLPYPSVKMWRERLTKEDDHFMLVATRGEQVVGAAGLEWDAHPRIRHVGRIGMTVDEQCRGQGIGQKLLAELIDVAENWLGLLRIELVVYTDNSAAIKLYEKLSFVTEGRLKSTTLREGELVDVFMMARVKSVSQAGTP